jgi:hypothetical protein
MAIVQALTSFWIISDPPRLVIPGELFDSNDPVVTSRPSKFSDPVGAGDGGGGEHPSLAAHVTLGLSAQHTHDYAPVHTSHVHTHTAGEVGASAAGHTHTLTDADIPAAIARDSEVLAAITAHLGAVTHGGAGGEGIPSGVIAMWAGLVANIPSGWNLCDGTNGTPDLTDRFIKGGVPGSTGGGATHSHAAHSAVINHTHAVNVTDPGHTHVQGVNSATTGGSSGYAPDTSTNTRVNSGYSTSSGTTGITAATANPADGVTELTHDSVNHEPAYYTLAFIQKA